MSWWQWLLVSAGAMALAYGAALAALACLGRGEDARAAARFLPDLAVLLGRLLRDGRVPRRRRLLLAALAAYLASPLDLVPDFIPVVGQLDDAIVGALVLRALVRCGGPELVREHWPGPERSLNVLLALAGARGQDDPAQPSSS